MNIYLVVEPAGDPKKLSGFREHISTFNNEKHALECIQGIEGAPMYYIQLLKICGEDSVLDLIGVWENVQSKLDKEITRFIRVV